jgi:hypothetical protein
VAPKSMMVNKFWSKLVSGKISSEMLHDTALDFAFTQSRL